MQTVKIVYWQKQNSWLGYFHDFPDYRTQGDTLDDLKEHLKYLHRDVTSGQIPGIRMLSAPEEPTSPQASKAD